jgi:hypothetical protein
LEHTFDMMAVTSFRLESPRRTGASRGGVRSAAPVGRSVAGVHLTGAIVTGLDSDMRAFVVAEPPRDRRDAGATRAEPEWARDRIGAGAEAGGRAR